MMSIASASSRSRCVSWTREMLSSASLPGMRLSSSSRAITTAAASGGVRPAVSRRTSGSSGSSYGAETPVNSSISPANAARRDPSGRAARTPRARSRRRSRRTARAARRASARACRISSYGEIAETTTAAPARAMREATQPMRAMLMSRSSFEKPRPFERCVRTMSPSRCSTMRPRRSSSGSTMFAIVVLPAPDRPVNQRTKPWFVVVHVCSPHSVRSVPAQRPSRPLPGAVECVSPIES